MSLEEELNSLKSNLSQTREKFITDWTTDHYNQFKHRQANLFKSFCKQDKESIVQHGETIENLRKHINLNEKGLEEKAHKLAILKHELEQMTNDITSALNYKDKVSAEIQHTQQNIEQSQEALKTTSTDLEQVQAEVEAQAAIYRDTLGLQMKKTSGGKIQFIFSLLDKNNPETKCYYFIKVSEADRKYIVSDCEPPVSDLDQLVDKLNQTNDLRTFVVAVRKRFKQILSSRG